MHDLSQHPDDFTVLRYVAGDLEETERTETGKHFEGCPDCSKTLEEVRQLDLELHALAAGRDSFGESDESIFAGDDVFRRRPLRRPQTAARRSSQFDLEAACAASERGNETRETLLAALDDVKALQLGFAGIDVSSPSDRYGLLYALQAASHRIAEAPAHALRFADMTLDLIRGDVELASSAVEETANRLVPRFLLMAQAHLLAGQACIWLGEFDGSEPHLALAYRLFAQGPGEEMSLATVEHVESQRRSFTGRGREGLALAQRAITTFEALGLEDMAARSRVCEGLALFDLDRQEEALAAYRATLPVFEKLKLWSNYVGALNSIGTSLAKLGRLDEARQGYARALRVLSRDEHRSWLGFIRHGLADVLFAAGRYREAAISLAQASRVYAECGLHVRALMASLFEAESWARNGELDRARHRLDIFRSEVARQDRLDSAVAGQIKRALAGLDPELRDLAKVRERAEKILREEFNVRPA